MKEEKVLIPCGSIRLEGRFGLQDQVSSKGGAVLCHPHPQYGGTMDNPVIRTAVEAVSSERFSTLRFNFRGVGESEGSYGEGVEERRDVAAAVDYLASRIETAPLGILGYSFGAWAGFPVAIADERVKWMIAIAPPLEIYDFDFLKGSRKKKLIIAGDADAYCPLERLEDWFQGLDDPKTLRIIRGADHFFFSHHRLLAEPLAEFLRGG